LNCLVLDASVALAWCFPDESDPGAREVLRTLRTADALVPAIWPLEVANALLVAERSKRLAPPDATRFLALLEELPLRVDVPILSRALRETRALAKAYGLSSYDAAYLELAMREGVPLATLDEPLRKAARKAQIPLLDR